MTLSLEDVQVLMTQYRLRISEKLKSAYPDAVWKWDKEPTLRNLMDGDTVRIQVENMAAFTQADVSFDFYGRIHIEPMTIGNFLPENAEDCEASIPKEPAVVDVKAWFDLVGRQILDKQITELHAQGHNKVTIKENGDIVINCQKKDRFLFSLDAFPGKNYWQELICVLGDNELEAKIAGNTIQVSWI